MFLLADIAATSAGGLEPLALHTSYSNSTPLTAMLVGSLVLGCLNAGGIAHALKSYSHELWSIRHRANLFDDEHSATAFTAAILMLIFVVFGGVVLYNISGIPTNSGFRGVFASMCLMAVYYLFRYVAYQTVGYTFGSNEQRRTWLNGFMATQAYAGLGMIIPAFLLIYKPDWLAISIIISLIVYCAAQILFIIKSIRIFYTNFTSLVYFILYLCTLEIVPAFAVYTISVYLTANIA